MTTNFRHRAALAALTLALTAMGAGRPDGRSRTDPDAAPAGILINRPLPPVEAAPPRPRPAAPAPASARTASAAVPDAPDPLEIKPQQVVSSVTTVGLFALASLAPAAVLMFTAFVRINIVLVLLRQALGSPQVPGNQVLTALSLLLTALVMRPVGEAVYTRAVEPYARGRVTWSVAYRDATGPVKAFMLEQIERTRHKDYVWAIHDEVTPPGQPEPTTGDEFSLGVVATAYLLSELTTALVIGFYLYLPFLVVDLVVSAVLAAMGLFMLPPSLVSLPLKMILFVLVNGWLHVATMLIQSFGPVAVAASSP